MQPSNLSSSEEYSSDEFVPIAQLAVNGNIYSGKTSHPLYKRSVSDDVSNESFTLVKDRVSKCFNESHDSDDAFLTYVKNSSLSRNIVKVTGASSKPITRKVKVTNKPDHTSSPKKTKISSGTQNKENIFCEIINTKNFSNIVTPSSVLYSKSLKGQLIQSVLCRWWYAYTWPDPMSIPSKNPSNCDYLDGFPGVYIHTSGHRVGKIIDYRDMSTCPNFINFTRKSSAELRELLLRAIQKQRIMMNLVEGEGSIWLNELNNIEKWANKLNDERVDREASIILKTECLSL